MDKNGQNRGRPLKYPTVEEFETKVNEYFESLYQEVIERDKKGNAIIDVDGNIVSTIKQIKPPTKVGLALFMGLDRHNLVDYTERIDKNGKEFRPILMRVDDICLEYNMNVALNPTTKNVQGVLFNLRANYGMNDKIQIEQTVNGQITVENSLITLTDIELEQKRRELETKLGIVDTQ